MADIGTFRRTRLSRLLVRTILGSPALVAALAAQQAQAQSVVSACSGVSLPPSVVTDILSPVVTGIAGQTESTVNGVIANVPLLSFLLSPLNTNAGGLLSQAASGAPITLQAIATDGTLIGAADQCTTTADSITLNTPAGVAIGGNQITGLGAAGAPAFASDINALALGNNARAEAGAAGSLALGANSSATGANSVALGAGSVASRGPVTGYVALGVAGPQNSAGEVSVGAPGALRQLTNVAAGTAPTDAATVGQVEGVLAQVGALDAAAVRYDNAVTRDRITLTGAAGTTIGNVAPGALTATSTEAVNGAQLFATNQAVGANTTAITNLGAAVGSQPLRYADAATPTTPNGGVVSDDATLAGASGGPVGLHNVRGGAVVAGSTDAVNGDQLAATNAQVAGNSTSITNLNTTVTDLGAAIANQPLRYSDAATPTTPNGGVLSDDATLAGASGGPVGLHNVRGGAVVAGSTDAVNGDQLAATNTQVTVNTTAITNLNNLLVGSTVSPVQYSNPDAPTTPNGGTLTNDVTLIGAQAAAPVALHNVAGGVVAAGSTDAVNGQQLFEVSTAASNSLQYDRDGAGARTNTVTLAGGDAAAPVTLANVAAGAVTAESTEAVNGQQLYAVSNTASNSLQYDRDATGARTNTVTLAGGTDGAPVTVANVAAGRVAAGSSDAVNGDQLNATNQVAQRAAALGANSVQYDPGATAVTFANGAGTPVALRNVAAGTAPTDAVNVGQLQSGMQSTLARANAYTDDRLNNALTAVNFDLRRARRDIGAGTSGAMAAAALPQANEPGKSMVAIGGGTYRGQTAVAFGASTFLNDGHSILRVGATYDSRGYGGANAGYGYQF